MKKNSYSFKLGKFACLVVNDGLCSMPDSTSAHASQGQPDFIEIDTLSLFINTGKNQVLVDTGLGAGGEMAPGAGQLTANLAEAGIRPTEIDAIIFSHGHVDHIGGNLDDKGNPIFPNARYFMSRKEWEFWASESNYGVIPKMVRNMAFMAVQKNLLPLKDAINLFDNEKEIVPGVSCIFAPGHSVGQIALLVSSDSEHLLCLFDVFHQPLEIEKPEVFLIPPTTGEAQETRAKLLSRALEPGILVFASHFPFPGLGHIVPSQGVNHWEPMGS